MDYREVVAVLPEQMRLPAQLLVDRHLGKSAKLLWAFWHLGLGRRPSGLCRYTYRDAMAQLRSGGWLSVRSRGSGDPPFLSQAGMGRDRQFLSHDRYGR